jgi:hypothetical protein
MARSHYVMDLFYSATERSKPTRRDALRIDAPDDQSALAEAVRIDGWRKPAFYQLRAIHNSTRTGDKLIFSSEVVDEPEPGAVIEVASGDPVASAARVQQ